MLKYLDAIIDALPDAGSDDEYDPLYDRFDKIHYQLESVLKFLDRR